MNAIEVNGLAKRYFLGVQGGLGYRTLHDTVSGVFSRRRLRHPREELWALQDVSFAVQEGEVLGIIGRNGAGKSTLLKILCRITEPTAGHARLIGRVGALLEVGTGFHPELTGRENVLLNGTILGMRRREVSQRLDEILAFAGLERFADTPIKRYSSGMTVRLGFAVAAHLEPDILIVDEVLAVGDAEFQQKAMGRIQHVSSSGRTILLVSHNMPSVSALATRCLLIDEGHLVLDSDPKTVIDAYLRQGRKRAAADLSTRRDRSGSGAIRIVRIALLDSHGGHLSAAGVGSRAVFEVGYESRDGRSDRVAFGLQFLDSSGRVLATCNSYNSSPRLFETRKQGVAYCEIPRLPFFPGTYTVHCSAQGPGAALLDLVDFAFEFEVKPADFFGTGRLPHCQEGLLVDHSWEHP